MTSFCDVYGVPSNFFDSLRQQLAVESDRGRLLLIGIAIETLLKAKFLNEGLKPETLFGMLKRANELNWIDADVYHDAEIIRKLRNRCAHEGRPIELDADDVRVALEQFRVPRRRYYDWGKVRAASTSTGMVFYTNDRPAKATEDLEVPAAITFTAGIGVILLVLAANLEVPIAQDEAGSTALVIELPDFMSLVEGE